MELRKGTPGDYRSLYKILLSMRIEEKDMGYWKQGAETWVMENGSDLMGFYTYRIQYGIPYLIHFWVDPKARSHSLFRRLAGSFKRNVREKDTRHFIVNAPKANAYVNRLLIKYLKRKPYGEDEDQFYYLGDV